MPEHETLEVTRIGERALVRLKSWLPDPLSNALAPTVASAAARVVHLGPGEWWVLSDSVRGPQLHDHLVHQAKAQGIAVVDLSQAFAVLRVNGPPARDVLMKGCGLDLDSNSFPIGRCTRTRFGQLHIALHCIDATPLFELYVGRSHAAYLESWLNDAALEFQNRGAKTASTA